MQKSKIAAISDPHLSMQKPLCRTDDLREVQFEKLDHLYQRADAEGCLAVILAGDIVDTACSWALMPAVAKFFSRYVDHITTLVVFGQHDTYMYDEDGRQKTILGSLAEAGLVRVLGVKPLTIELGGVKWHIYGASFGQPVPEVVDDEALNMLAIHASICDESLWEGQDYLDASRFLKDHPEFDVIFAGDIHKPFVIEDNGRYIANSGPMTRRSLSEADFVPQFFIYDLQELSLVGHPLPHQPSSDIISDKHRQQAQLNEQIVERMVSMRQQSEVGQVLFKDVLRKVIRINRNKITSGASKMIAETTGFIDLEANNDNR